MRITLEERKSRNVILHFDYQPPKEMFEAIAYLSGWSYNSYDTVNIFHDYYDDDRMDLVAQYSNADSERVGYVIGAIWDRERKCYSFHS